MTKRSDSFGLGRGLDSQPRGRGLDALLGDGSTEPEQSGVLKLPIAKVQPNAAQPRKLFDSESLSDLADSIREHGILQPINVRQMASGYYQIISGERRWRAAREAGLEEVPVLVLEADDREAMELGLIENLQREDLNAMEEAQGYDTLMKEYGMTQEQVAARVGKSRSAVANAVRLLGLPDNLQAMVEDGRLSAGHARAVLSVSDPTAQNRLAEEIDKRGLSVREAEHLAAKLRAQQEQEPPPETPKDELEVDYAALAAKDLADVLGRRVKITQGKRKGKLELEFYGVDDLNDLLDAMKLLPKKGG
ncbi:MAG: ParB/RepB/Spo0J family partition protein [Clostridiales bacterium]|nr:ParB/RepB/Spo0J family partition protein [Clostridiales bacterium]